MRVAILVVVTALAGCQSAASSEEAKYNNLKSVSANSAALCDQSTKVRDAYGAAGDKENYDSWRVKAFNDCHDAHPGSIPVF